MHRFAQICPLTDAAASCTIGALVPLLEEFHAVCDRVSRQETGKASVSASIQGRAIPRPSGKRRAVYSGNGLPRYSLVPCQWLFSADERQSRESHANFAKTRIHSWMDYKPLSIFCEGSGEPRTALAGALPRTCAQFPFNRNTLGSPWRTHNLSTERCYTLALAHGKVRSHRD